MLIITFHSRRRNVLTESTSGINTSIKVAISPLEIILQQQFLLLIEQRPDWKA